MERLRREYKERSERLALTTAVEKSDTYKECSSWAVPDEAFAASRVESNDGDATSSHDWLSESPGPE